MCQPTDTQHYCDYCGLEPVQEAWEYCDTCVEAIVAWLYQAEEEKVIDHINSALTEEPTNTALNESDYQQQFGL